MSIVKVKTKGQVTLPTAIRKEVGLNIGDLLEAKIEQGKITLTPKSLIDRHIEEGLEDIKKGRTYGPFDTAEEMVVSLQSNMKKRAKQLKRSR
ncbi:MAG: AbrB/MazE/SpoVT family DNA-binding domain-containing protein [Acidobacteria bacterium]|nr:AbrB/MazE/SpoVT family DNA-binding domain-containing protein [Acidobacteriota bacterium]